MHRFLEETVADHMTTDVKTITRNVSIEQLKKRFEKDDFNAYPVVEHGEVLGLMTKFDFLKIFAMKPSSMVPHYNDLMKRTAGDAMTIDFIYVNPATKLTRVLQLMVEHRVRSIPVIRADRDLVGIISREDLMSALWLYSCPNSELRE